jgi:hypothetical protein
MGGLKAPTHEVAHDKARELDWIRAANARPLVARYIEACKRFGEASDARTERGATKRAP